MLGRRLIETDHFPFEFLSALARRESWRKEVHRPIYHIHKWWAKRLGSVFRGITLGCILGEDDDLTHAFHEPQDYAGITVFDPFMGSGTTLGEAHKLGLAALGRDINPVAVEAVRVALGSLQSDVLEETFRALSRDVGARILRLYETRDLCGRPATVLYFFWVMQAACPVCRNSVDLFSSWMRARNAYPKRKPAVQVLCPRCDSWFTGLYTDKEATCPSCALRFDPREGIARGSKASRRSCGESFAVRPASLRGGKPPRYRLYGKLVLTKDGRKEYLPATTDDHYAFGACRQLLLRELERESFRLPTLALQTGHNTRQAMAYGFREWRDFFNVRQLLALG